MGGRAGREAPSPPPLEATAAPAGPAGPPVDRSPFLLAPSHECSCTKLAAGKRPKGGQRPLALHPVRRVVRVSASMLPAPSGISGGAGEVPAPVAIERARLAAKHIARPSVAALRSVGTSRQVR